MPRPPILPGSVYGPYTVLGVTAEPATARGRVYEVRCVCGREYRRNTVRLGAATRHKTCAACCKRGTKKPVTPRPDVADLLLQVQNIGIVARRLGLTNQRVSQIAHAEGLGCRWVRVNDATSLRPAAATAK